MSDDLIERLRAEAEFWRGQPSGPDLEALCTEAADALAAKDTTLSEMQDRLATAYRVKAECNDTANEERHLRLAAEAELERVKKALEPFASAAGYLSDANGWSDNDEIELCYDDGIRISVIPLSAFRAAARALAPSIQDETDLGVRG